jgi:hypothetical protein
MTALFRDREGCGDGEALATWSQQSSLCVGGVGLRRNGVEAEKGDCETRKRLETESGVERRKRRPATALGVTGGWFMQCYRPCSR